MEKRNTVFDKKSSDCDRRKDYVPNFTMLGKFGLSREKSKNQTSKRDLTKGY